jgi:hypothetical protein
MGRPTLKTLVASAADTTSTGWISLNTNQENFHVGFSIRHLGPGVAPVLNVEGTMQDVLVDGSVAAANAFALISAVETSIVGTNVAGELTFPVAAVRLSTISGGSANSTLEFNVVQAGKF